MRNNVSNQSWLVHSLAEFLFIVVIAVITANERNLVQIRAGRCINFTVNQVATCYQFENRCRNNQPVKNGSKPFAKRSSCQANYRGSFVMLNQLSIRGRSRAVSFVNKYEVSRRITAPRQSLNRAYQNVPVNPPSVVALNNTVNKIQDMFQMSACLFNQRYTVDNENNPLAFFSSESHYFCADDCFS